MREAVARLREDIRYAVRGLRRSPAFAIPVVLTLGLGIGANAAMFGVVDRLMFRPDPYLRDPATVDRVYLKVKGWERDNAFSVFPYTRYLDFRRWTTKIADQAAFVTATVGVGTGERARDRVVLGVSSTFFRFFDARPALGRFFGSAEDSLPAGANVAILSYGLWQTEYGQRDVIGQSIQVGNASYTIIGVAPRRFVGVSEGDAPAVFIPVTAYGANDGDGTDTFYRQYSWDWIGMIVRRKPGVSRDEATADLTNAFRLSWVASRVVHPGYAPLEQSRPQAIAGALKTAAGPSRGLEARTLLWVTGVAAIVLLIASANVANLFLARAMRRRREMTLRLALGIPRARLVSQLFTETLTLSLLGCAVGVLVAQWGGLAMRRLFIGETSAIDLLADWRTLGIASAAALVAAIATGIVPVVFAGREDMTGILKSGTRAGTYQRSAARTTLLVMQGALSVVLLVGAGLFVRSLSKVRALPLGYDADPVLVVDWRQRGTALDAAGEQAVRSRMLETALTRGDVERGAWVTSAPFARGTSTMALAVPDVDSVARLGRFTYQSVSPDYFSTLRTRLLRGRAFSGADRSGAPRVVIVSQAMADRLWPGQDALGRCIKVDLRTARPDTLPCTTVVGVAADAVHDPVADVPMRYYLPENQMPFRGRWLLLRMRRDPAAAAEDVRRAIQAVMPGAAIVSVTPARAMLDAKRRSWLVGATLFVGFGALALLVAAVGLYGVIAYMVAQRVHDLGVRIALGAQTHDIVRLVLAQGVRYAGAGLVVGAAGSLAAARWVQPLLFHQSARDPIVFLTVGALLVVVTGVASGIPAWRATRADPNTVLRTE
jgi:predicted permease